MAWGTILEGTKVLNATTDMENTGTIVTPHASTNEGDALVAICGIQSPWDHVYVASTGWDLLFTVLNFHGDDTTSAVYTKYAGSSEGSSTFKTDRDNDSPPNFGVILTFPGGDPTTLIDVAYDVGDHVTLDINVDTPNDVPHDPITTVTDNSMVVCYAHMNEDENVLTAVAATGYTVISSSFVDADRQYIVQYKEVVTAGTETPGVSEWTHDGFLIDVAYITFALRGATVVPSIPNKIVQVNRTIQRASNW